VPQANGPRKDRNTMKRGGSRSYRPFETDFTVIPGREANPE
jgi:hypothetical protein